MQNKKAGNTRSFIIHSFIHSLFPPENPGNDSQCGSAAINYYFIFIFRYFLLFLISQHTVITTNDTFSAMVMTLSNLMIGSLLVHYAEICGGGILLFIIISWMIYKVHTFMTVKNIGRRCSGIRWEKHNKKAQAFKSTI